MAIILASSSPQRRLILKEMGVEFKVDPADIDEHHGGLRRPHAIVKFIARRKADAVSRRHPEDWVIGCDTLVVLYDGLIAVKPNDRDDARKTLKKYRGRHCDVYSGLSLVNRHEGKRFIGFERTRIWFNDFSDSSLEEYLDTGDWKGRSGSMTIEGRGGWTRKMEGEYWNVVGLPVDLLKKALKKFRLV